LTLTEKERVLKLTNAIDVEKTDTKEGGTYLRMISKKTNPIFSAFNWELKIIEPSLAKSFNSYDKVDELEQALHEDMLSISNSRVSKITDSYSQNSERNFTYIIKFQTEVKRNGS
jgi:hypothetical protein